MLYLCVELAAAIHVLNQLTRPDIWGDADAPVELQNALRSIEGEINETCTFVLGDWISTWPEGKMPFNLLLRDLSCLKCQDPRDKVYGVLALIDWRGGPPLIPDYSRSPFSLALALSKIMRVERILFMAPELLRNLGVDKEDPDVKFGIVLRQRNRAGCLQGQTREPHSLAPRKEFKYTKQAWQLTEHDRVRRLAYKSENPGLMCSRGYDIIAPPETRPGDWIIYGLNLLDQEARKPRHDGIVLRRVGSVYAVIGRAIEVDPVGLLMEHDMKDPDVLVKMSFDYEDFLILAATHKQLSAKETIETGVCSEPFSSFATLYEEATIEPRVLRGMYGLVEAIKNGIVVARRFLKGGTEKRQG